MKRTRKLLAIILAALLLAGTSLRPQAGEGPGSPAGAGHFRQYGENNAAIYL